MLRAATLPLVAPPATLARALAWLAAGAVPFVLAGYGLRGLNEPDEGRYALIALAMADGRSGWWLPQMSDYLHLDKPPLAYWLTALALRLFGPGEWAARLPSAFGAVAALGGLGWLALRRHGREVALLAVCLCATSLQFWLMARVLSTDMLLTGFTMLAAGAWAQAAQDPSRATRWWALSVGCWTLAWLTKGTPALVPLVALAAALAWLGDRDGRLALRPVATLLLVVSFGSFWFLDLMLRLPEAVDFFLERELVGRIAGHPDGHVQPFAFHFATSLVQWLPWWPLAARAAVKSRAAFGLEGRVLLLGLLLLSIASTKLPTYTLPLAPWAALLFARWLHPRLAAADGARWRGGCALVGGGSVALALGLSLYVPTIETRLGGPTTLREVAATLREAGARTAIAASYHPGLEYYFGERVLHLRGAPPRQLRDDAGCDATLGRDHFMTPAEFLAEGPAGLGPDTWFVVARRKRDAAIETMLARWADGRRLAVGDYDLIGLRTTAGAQAARCSREPEPAPAPIAASSSASIADSSPVISTKSASKRAASSAASSPSPPPASVSLSTSSSSSRFSSSLSLTAKLTRSRQVSPSRVTSSPAPINACTWRGSNGCRL